MSIKAILCRAFSQVSLADPDHGRERRRLAAPTIGAASGKPNDPHHLQPPPKRPAPSDCPSPTFEPSCETRTFAGMKRAGRWAMTEAQIEAAIESMCIDARPADSRPHRRVCQNTANSADDCTPNAAHNPPRDRPYPNARPMPPARATVPPPRAAYRSEPTIRGGGHPQTGVSPTPIQWHRRPPGRCAGPDARTHRSWSGWTHAPDAAG